MPKSLTASTHVSGSDMSEREIRTFPYSIVNISGDHSGVETPVPIPNTAVKHPAPMILANAGKVGHRRNNQKSPPTKSRRAFFISPPACLMQRRVPACGPEDRRPCSGLSGVYRKFLTLLLLGSRASPPASFNLPLLTSASGRSLLPARAGLLAGIIHIHLQLRPRKGRL